MPQLPTSIVWHSGMRYPSEHTLAALRRGRGARVLSTLLLVLLPGLSLLSGPQRAAAQEAGAPAEAVPVPVDAVESAAWRRTLERIASGVVSIQVDSTRAFDTEWNSSGQATGFVVDATRGLILTNRHVVTAGPVRAGARFLNQEEVELVPVYRDPVHDFGFYRYDPTALRYIDPTELALAPERAQVGREIRVVGNDAGEQLSILSGTLARLRRDAPDYGRGAYNDFNTFYFQAASGTSGGSSGSPVIDIDGRVVALNAGGSTEAASSFFLPLDRVQRALRLIRDEQPVTRGTLGATFRYVSYDELRRLGLREETESAIRREFRDGIGMLVVSEVLPGSPADGALQVGDVVVTLDGGYVTEFNPVAAVLDDRVGEEIEVGIERGGEPLVLPVRVADLHRLSPAEYLQFGNAIVHDLSYQQARHFNRPVEGVFVADPGFVLASAGIPRGGVIIAIDGAAIGNLDDLEKVLDGLADQQRAAVRYVTFDEPGTSKLRVIRMDRRWFPAVRCHRDDVLGLWPCRGLAGGPPSPPPQPGTATAASYRDARLQKAAPSLVLVNFDMPYTISGVSEQHYYGTGLILDAARGLVAVDRNTVPEAMGDVWLTFGGSLEIPGRVEYLHPVHNLAIVAYDPTLIGDTPVASAPLAKTLPEPGSQVWVIGLRNGEELVSQRTQFASLESVNFPLSRTMRFRDANLETLKLVNPPGDVDGIVVDERGDVIAAWSSFAWQGAGSVNQESRGMPVDYLREVLDLARNGRSLHSLEVEWSQQSLVAARRLGLPAGRVEALATHDAERRQVLSVTRTVAGTPAADLLEAGDVLLSIDGRASTRFREAETGTQKPQVALEVLRDREVLRLDVATAALDGRGTRRAMMWAGALLQAPYRDMAAQRGVERSGVYVSYFSFGSPASRYGLFAGRRIVEVDGRSVADLDEFIGQVRDRRDRESVRLTTITWNNQLDVLTLKLDETYWPAYEILWQHNAWQRLPITSGEAASIGTLHAP